MRISNLSDLRIFLTLCELGSLSKAAKALHLSLSAVSLRLKHLENDLTCRLVNRTSKGIELTEAGRILEREAEEVRARIDLLLQRMAPFATEEATQLRVAGNYSSSVAAIPEAIRCFLSRHPDVQVEHLSLRSEEVAAAVALGTVDLGVCVWDGPFQGVAFHEFATDHLGLVVPIDHPLANLSELHFAAALEHPFVTLSEDCALQNFINERARESGRTIHRRVEAASYEVLLSYIEIGIGIGVLPLRTCRTVIKHRPGLIFVPFADAWATRTLRIALPADPLRRTRLSEAFLETLVEQA